MQALSQTCAGGASSSLRTNADAFDAVAGVSSIAQLMGETLVRIAAHLAGDEADPQSAEAVVAVARCLAQAQRATNELCAALEEAAQARPGELDAAR